MLSNGHHKRGEQILEQIIEQQENRAKKPQLDPVAKHERPKEVFANLALARNALASVTGAEGDLSKNVVLTSAGHDLQKDGCDFIHAAQWFLTLLGCPSTAIDFVLTLMGISAGDHEQLMVITDDHIAEVSGISRQSVSKKRKALMRWEQQMDYSVVEIHEGKWNHETGHFKPTRYRLVLLPYVARFVQEGRSSKVLSKNPKNNIKQATEDGTYDLAIDIAADMPNAPIVKRINERFQKPAGQQGKIKFVDSDKLFNEMLADLAKYRDSRRIEGKSAYEGWREFIRKGSSIISEPTEGYADPGDQ